MSGDSKPAFLAWAKTLWRSPRRKRAAQIGRRISDFFPWRPLGLLVALFAYAALAEAFFQLDLVLLVLGYGALGVLGLSTLFVFIGAIVVKRRLIKTDAETRSLHAETLSPAISGFRLPTYAWLPLIQVSWQIESPTGLTAWVDKNKGQWREALVATTRGTRAGLRRRVVVQDPFGLVRLAFRHDDPIELRVRPHVGALSRLPSLVAFAGGEDRPHPMGIPEGDRVELRRYAPGDPARFIHWKIFARTRKLIVRLPELALVQTHRTIAYLVAGEGDEATAAAARVAITQGLGEDWSFAADGSSATSRIDEAEQAIIASSSHRDRGAMGLEAFVAGEEKQGPASLILFVPPTQGDWAPRVVAMLKSRPGRCRILVGVDGLSDHTPPPWWKRLIQITSNHDSSAIAPLDAILKQLSSYAPVAVVDRRTGRELGRAHLQAAREMSRAKGLFRRRPQSKTLKATASL